MFKKVLKNHVCVLFRPGTQLAETAPVLGTGGKPSTGQHLPLRLYRLYAVFAFVSSLSYLCLALVFCSVLSLLLSFVAAVVAVVADVVVVVVVVVCRCCCCVVVLLCCCSLFVVVCLCLCVFLFFLFFCVSCCACFSYVFFAVGGCLGSFLVVLGVVLGLLGGLGGSFGRSWGVLERSSRRLTVRAVVKTICPPHLVRFWIHLGTPRRNQNDPKTTKNRSQNRLEKRLRFTSILRRSWGDLGPILAPSWGRFWWFSIGFCTVSWKSTFSKQMVSRHVLGRSWSDLGRQRGCKTRPFSTQVGVKKGKEK